MTDIFSNIRLACAKVAAQARHVQIVENALVSYPQKLNLNATQSLTDMASDCHLFGRGDETVRFFVVLDTINFGSGYFPFLKKEPLSGYYTIAKCLTEYCRRHGVPDAKALSVMSAPDCHAIFGQGTDNPYINELMQLFAGCWNELGLWALDKYDGDLLGFLKASKTANEAVQRLTCMPSFRDVSSYNGLTVPFYKRAQIMLQDIKLA